MFTWLGWTGCMANGPGSIAKLPTLIAKVAQNPEAVSVIDYLSLPLGTAMHISSQILPDFVTRDTERHKRILAAIMVGAKDFLVCAGFATIMFVDAEVLASQVNDHCAEVMGSDLNFAFTASGAAAIALLYGIMKAKEFLKEEDSIEEQEHACKKFMKTTIAGLIKGINMSAALFATIRMVQFISDPKHAACYGPRLMRVLMAASVTGLRALVEFFDTPRKICNAVTPYLLGFANLFTFLTPSILSNNVSIWASYSVTFLLNTVLVNTIAANQFSKRSKAPERAALIVNDGSETENRETDHSETDHSGTDDDNETSLLNLV